MTPTGRLNGVQAVWLGSVDFAVAHQLNLDLAALARDGVARLCAFEPARPVLTLGRRQWGDGAPEIEPTLARCADRGIEVLRADRGGLATLHVPGQLVVFIAVPCPREGAADLVDELFGAVEQVARRRSAPLERLQGQALGLWRGGAKIASAGLRVSDGVARHGISVNVAIDERLSAGLSLCGNDRAGYGNLAYGGHQSHRPAPKDAVRALADELVGAWGGSFAGDAGGIER